ncbi:MAG: FAD-dependent oxidoreductase [Streptosporangiaceae bacterium]
MTAPVTLPRTSLNVARRARDVEALAGGEVVDLLVVGGGITGAGVALDAASRGLSVALVERGDLANGTSRWSSKLVHGGLRYLARGEVGIALESARERGILMEHTAPHLVRALPIVLPFEATTREPRAWWFHAGTVAGDTLRMAVGTSRTTLPGPRRVSRIEALRLAPGLREDGLRAALVSWDGQLVDDVRLVVAVARTAAGHGARIVTRCSAVELSDGGARLRDELTGEAFDVRARAVVNAAGVWSAGLAADVPLLPSRGTHLVVPGRRLGLGSAGITVPVPGEPTRFVFALPQPDGRAYVGLTDVPVDGEPGQEPRPTEEEIDFLLRTLNTALESPVGRADVVGTFSGLRPLLGATSTRATAELVRDYTVRTGAEGVVTVVGGKLTTYRHMAEKGVDAAVRVGDLPAGPCRTRRLPLVGAAPERELGRVDAARRLVQRYGIEAPLVVGEAEGDPALLDPLAEGVDVTGAELLFGLRHEGALGLDDLLDRRTRVGLVPADRERVTPIARQLVDAYGSGDGGVVRLPEARKAREV